MGLGEENRFGRYFGVVPAVWKVLVTFVFIGF